MEISWLFLAFALLAAFLSLSNLTSRKKKLPPGPNPWPIIGNLNLLGSIPHQSLHILAKKYGELMYMKFGFKHVLIVSSPEMAKEFLKTHDNNFASRPSIAVGKYIAYNFSDMLWSPYGSYWRQARKIYSNELLKPKILNSYEYLRIQERKALISNLHAFSGKPIVLRDHFSGYNISILSRMIFGAKYFTESKTDRENKFVFTQKNLQGMLDEWFFLNGVFEIGDWIPFLSRFDLRGYVKRMKELHKNFEIFHNHVLDDHLNNNKRDDDKDARLDNDMVEILLQQAQNPNLEIQLTRDNIKALLQDLLVGGTETSTTALEWAITELMRHPQIIEKANEELDRVIGRERWMKEDDYSNLPYLDAIVKETMRIHPPGTLLAPHYAIENCNVAGYDISKGTIVFINVWSIGRDPKYWNSPDEFLPERFLRKDIDLEGQNFALLPFGSGRRGCPGKTLALKVIKSILGNLLHGFNWKLLPGVKPEDICMEEFYGSSTRPKYSFPIIFEPRLSSHHY